MANDVDTLRRDVSLSRTAIAFGVDLERDGEEWTACCPFHAEDTPSFTIFTGKDNVQRFHCFGCGEKGDVLDFVQRIKGVKLREAIAILGGQETERGNVLPKEIREARNIYAGIEPLPPQSEIQPGDWVKLYNPKRAGHEWEWGKFKAEMVFPYRREDGSLVGYVLRRALPDGGKETPMVMWVRLPDGRECWSRFPFPKPRPLYRVDKLRPGQVIIVEGEKCADKLRAASGRNVVTWPGGTQGVAHADWSPLAGRSCIVWPDFDRPGYLAADAIAARMRGDPRVIDMGPPPASKQAGAARGE